MYLSAIDKKILNDIQNNFPVCINPYHKIGEKLCLSENEVIERIKELQENGLISRFGVSVNHRKLGYYSTLIAMKVSSEKMKDITEEIVAYSEVTHCFIREGEYNFWFVFITPDNKKIETLLDYLIAKLGGDNVLNLVTRKKLKLKTELEL